MFVLSANGAALVDLTGLNILPINQQVQMDDGSVQVQTVGFELVGYGIGYSVSLGVYQMEQQARDIFSDILVKLKAGKTEFYDIREQEQKFVGRVG